MPKSIATDQDAVEKRLRRLIELGQTEVMKFKWERYSTSPVFDLSKAACLSLFAELAYLYVTEDEYKKRPRSKLVPCYGFHAAMSSWPPTNVRISASRILEDRGGIDIIESRSFVLVVIYFDQLIVVSVRGTAFLYDWFANLSVRKSYAKYRFGNNAQKLRFHSGFLREAMLAGLYLQEQINGRKPYKSLLVTGHSLGGAIASLLYAGVGSGLFFDECYTFASPRITNTASLTEMRRAPNLVNELDIVPRVPPTFFGYDNHLFEFTLNGTPNYQVGAAAESHFASWLAALAKGQLTQNHFIETYRSKVRHSANVEPV